MGDIVPKLVKANAKGFAAEKKLTSDRAYLLTRQGETTSFLGYELVGIWRHDFNNFTREMNLQIASLDSVVVDKIKRATDISVNGQVYEILERDFSPPDLERSWWDIYGQSTGEKYIHVEPEPEP